MKKNKKISEEYIIYKYLRKLNFKKIETFNFKNDASFLKIPRNKIPKVKEIKNILG